MERQPMLEDLVIGQVTDMHIGPAKVSYQGINVYQQFLDVLEILANKSLDLVIFSGDLAAIEGEPEAYTWIKQVLSPFPHPYIMMPGNHDHVGRMAQVFDLPEKELSNGMLYFSRYIKGRYLIFLDSSPYRVTKPQLEWLREELATHNEPLLLFIHHPPLLCDCSFMDERHALQNIDDVWETLEQFAQVKYIFCGHYHTEKTLVKDGKTVYLTPSTTFQINDTSPTFAIAHTQPGWRIIEWRGSQVHTYVEYLTSEK